MKVDWQDSFGWRDGKYQKAWTWKFSEEYEYTISENGGQYWPVSSMSGLGISDGCSSLEEAKRICIAHYRHHFVSDGYPDVEL
jgi:hypothetical protein